MKTLMGAAFLVLALSGAATAQDHGDAQRHGRGHAPPHGGRPADGHDTAHFADHLGKRLNLTDEQAANVKDILDGFHKEAEGLAKDSHDKVELLRRRAWADIRATLNEKQQSEFDKLIAEVHGQADGRVRQGPRVGDALKDFALTDSVGKAFRLAAFRPTQESAGAITVLTFWCTTCGSCRMVEADLDKTAAEYKGKGVQFLMVASNHEETPDGVNSFLEQNKLSFRVLMDPESKIARYLGAVTTTTTAVVDAEGRLRYYGSLEKAEDAVRNLMAGEDVAIPETPPTGCMIMTKPAPEQVMDDKGRGHGHGARHDHAGGG